MAARGRPTFNRYGKYQYLPALARAPSQSSNKCGMKYSILAVICICIAGLIYIIPYLFSEQMEDLIDYTRANLIKLNTKIEEYLHPPPYCETITDKFQNESIYINNFPSDVTIEEIIAKRTEPIENIPMCPSGNKTNHDQYKHILDKLPKNYIAYANRCQINAINRHSRQFGGLLSGDPLKPYHSTQIGFLHVYKAGLQHFYIGKIWSFSDYFHSEKLLV